MKKILIVFDGSVDAGVVDGLSSLKEAGRVDLFALTSDWPLVYGLEKRVASSAPGADVVLLNSAEAVNEEVDEIGRNIPDWSNNVGETVVAGKRLKDWFLIRGGEVSTWWFSMLSEKNTLKTDAFFRIAQIQALYRLLKTGAYDGCIVSVDHRDLAMSLKRVSRRLGVRTFQIGPAGGFKKSILKNLENMAAGAGFFKDIAHALLLLARRAARGVTARRVMNGFTERRKHRDSILCVSYFPQVDKKAADGGIFRNRYFPALQDKLSSMQRPVNWLLMYVSIGQNTYADALKMGRSFASTGEAVFFMEEFLTPAVALRALYLWTFQVFKYLRVGLSLDKTFLTEGLCVPEGAFLLEGLWRGSIAGKRGMEGVIYYETFKKVFEHFRDATHCLYSAEMHAWEKALNAARRNSAPGVSSVGFQHTAIPKNFFHYFHSPAETLGSDSSGGLPLPDIFACNGDIPFGLMEKQKYPNLVKVEAIRQLYLAGYLKRKGDENSGEPVLMVTGSIDRAETTALIRFVDAAYQGYKPFTVWLKGHPALPMQQVCRSAGIDPAMRGYVIKDGPIDVLLAGATAVLAGSSTVALEALALGKEVVVPVMSDHMFMSPLAGFESFYHRVCTPEELKEALHRIFRVKARRNLNPEWFINKYWKLDESLKGWEEALGLC